MTVTGGARVESPTGAIGSFDPGSIGTLNLSGRAANGDRSSWINSGLNMGLSATSEGTIFIQDGGLLDATGLSVGTPGKGTVFVDGVHSSGVPSLLDVGVLEIGDGSYGNGTGDVTALNGGRIEATNVAVGSAGGIGMLTITDTGSSLVQTGASTITVGHASLGTAAINVQNSATLTTGTGAINVNATGQINLDSGAVFDAYGPINMNGGQSNFLGGTLHVDAFNGNLVNQGGTLAPGHSAGTTAFSGNYTQRPAAELEIEVGGVLPGNWDVLTAEGNANLDGTIQVVLTGGFEPVLGNSFTIITTNVGNVGGMFDSELLPIFNDLTFDVIYNPKSVVLAVIEAPLLLGDFDFDGDVDGRDFLAWQRGESASPFSAGDLADWQAYYGTVPIVAASTAVPEPGTAILLLAGTFGLCVRWRVCAAH
jgi:hypothetical protein